MNEKRRRMVGRWMDRAASSGVIASIPMRAMAPRSAIPVRSSCRKGRPPSTMPR
jgi:hypothetical protein